MTKGVILAFGDSLMAGWNTDFENAGIDDPFGDPSARVFVYGRWTDPNDSIKLGNSPYTGPDWVAHSPSTGNWQQTGATPLYSFGEKVARFYGLDEIYVILFGVSGSDASPLHPNPAGSWHPSIAGGLIPRFKNSYILPALATPELGDGTAVLGMLVSLGQNCCASTFPAGAVDSLVADIHSVTTEVARIAQLSSHPSVVLLQNPILPRAAPDGFDPVKVLTGRSNQKAWLNSLQSYSKALVDIDTAERQSDDIHPTQQGVLDVGSRAFFGLMSAVPSFHSIYRE